MDGFGSQVGFVPAALEPVDMESESQEQAGDRDPGDQVEQVQGVGGEVDVFARFGMSRDDGLDELGQAGAY